VIGSSGRDGPISGSRSIQLDQNSIVYGMGSLPEELLGRFRTMPGNGCNGGMDNLQTLL